MGIIKELPKGVIERIAAGEVVERPASVVKELIENSIDAGAGSIFIEVADGGRRRVAVMDDGCGMDMNDLALCVRRHATSKISNENDLWNIRTMGFRGEALAAIGAVSRLIIETKRNAPDVIEGSIVEVKGGEVVGPRAAGCPGGTKIVVSDLLFNVPARLKFLRSPNVEYGHVADAVQSLALANPQIRFDLREEGRRPVCLPAVSNDDDPKGIEERVLLVLGERYREKLVHIAEAGAGLALEGWVSEDGKRAGRDIHVFLNRRPVRDKMLVHAITSAFGDGTSGESCPAAVLWIDIDPALIDVNVHPTKREVRFSNSGAVHDFVRAGIKKAIARGEGRPLTLFVGTRDVGRKTGGVFVPACKRASSFVRATEGSGRPSSIVENGGDAGTGIQDTITTASETRLRPLGQLGLTYIVCEDADGALVLIDQHAAHERLGFDRLKAHYAEGSIPQQGLLIPENIELGAKELPYVLEHQGAMAAAGFEIEPFGGTTLLVKAVPELLGAVALLPVFEKMAAELEELGTSDSVEDAVERIFSVVACHRQVRGGDKLSFSEISSLVRDVEREGVTHCPHGRPVIIRMGVEEIEKWFKR